MCPSQSCPNTSFWMTSLQAARVHDGKDDDLEVMRWKEALNTTGYGLYLHFCHASHTSELCHVCSNLSIITT